MWRNYDWDTRACVGTTCTFHSVLEYLVHNILHASIYSATQLLCYVSAICAARPLLFPPPAPSRAIVCCSRSQLLNGRISDRVVTYSEDLAATSGIIPAATTCSLLASTFLSPRLPPSGEEGTVFIFPVLRMTRSLLGSPVSPVT